MTDEEFLDWLEATVQSSGAARITLAIEHRQRLYAISGSGILDAATTNVMRHYIKYHIALARSAIADRVARKLLS